MAQLVGRASAVVGSTTDIHLLTPRNVVGTRAFDNASNEYIYMQGVTSLVAYNWVSFDELFITTRLIANAQGGVAIAQAAIDLTTSYGWYLIYGSGLGTTLAGFVDNGKVYLTGTAGAVDDTDVAGDAVIGAIGRSALSGTTATFQVLYPHVLDLAVD